MATCTSHFYLAYPVVDPNIGITPMSLTVEILHTCNLGIYAMWCQTAAWFLTDAKVNGPNAKTADELLAFSAASVSDWILQRETPGSASIVSHESTI